MLCTEPCPIEFRWLLHYLNGSFVHAGHRKPDQQIEAAGIVELHHFLVTAAILASSDPIGMSWRRWRLLDKQFIVLNRSSTKKLKP